MINLIVCVQSFPLWYWMYMDFFYSYRVDSGFKTPWLVYAQTVWWLYSTFILVLLLFESIMWRVHHPLFILFLVLFSIVRIVIWVQSHANVEQWCAINVINFIMSPLLVSRYTDSFLFIMSSINNSWPSTIPKKVIGWMITSKSVPTARLILNEKQYSSCSSFYCRVVIILHVLNVIMSSVGCMFFFYESLSSCLIQWSKHGGNFYQCNRVYPHSDCSQWIDGW